MQHPVPAPQHTDEDGFNPRVEYPDNVAQLVRAALSQGYRLSPGTAAELWKRHSDDYCASWLVMEGRGDSGRGVENGWAIPRQARCARRTNLPTQRMSATV